MVILKAVFVIFWLQIHINEGRLSVTQYNWQHHKLTTASKMTVKLNEQLSKRFLKMKH